MSHVRRLLALAGLALSASPAWAGAPAAPVTLVSPRPGAALVAGAEAFLEWAPTEPSAGLPGVEEWEAFLSLDGGKTYPVRITPHLDQDLRRVRWRVPGLPTADARLLLRLGDEQHRETAFELPHRFSIAPAPAPGMEPPPFVLATVAAAKGEPALPGQAGVVAWVEGSRRGGAWRQKVAPPPLALEAQVSLPSGHSETAVPEAQEGPEESMVQAAGVVSPALPSGDSGPLRRPAVLPPSRFRHPPPDAAAERIDETGRPDADDAELS